jgi:signal transduction histidine kinase
MHQNLVSYLHALTERENASLAHHLHDDLGGLLVAALMDVAFAEQNLPAGSEVALAKLQRARHSLSAAIDLKRRIIEKLRPTLLDNVGLFSALRWQVKDSWGGAGIPYDDSYPAAEPEFREGAAIALFRIVQAVLSISMTHRDITRAQFTVRVEGDRLWLKFSDDGVPSPEEGAYGRDSPAFASLDHRVRQLQGGIAATQDPDRNSIEFFVPLDALRIAAPAL